MITAQLESFERLIPEIEDLTPLHWEELALNKDVVPLSPQYDVYIARERAGELVTMTLREAGKLIGYFIGFVAPGLHYSTCLTCHMDILFVHPEHRNGRAGTVLFKELEKELRRRGVQRWFVGTKCHHDISKFFERLGFERVEYVYSKMLEE